MKNTRLTSILSSSVIACALTIGSLTSAPSALAQSRTALVVNIPFAFQTENQTLPAGMYHIERESGSFNPFARTWQSSRICDDARCEQDSPS